MAKFFGVNKEVLPLKVMSVYLYTVMCIEVSINELMNE